MNKFKTFFTHCEDTLKKAGFEEAKNETQLIFSHVLNIGKGSLKLQKKIDKKHKKQILKIIKKRKKHIPLQYLLGDVQFLNLEIKVNKNALIPRNETEQLADLIISDIKAESSADNLNVLDMCCGSGCIGLSIAKNTKTFVTLADISKKALKLTKNNAKHNKISNFEVAKTNLFKKISKRYNFFVCNPPYIKTQEITTLQKQVKNFEPLIALDGGKDGYDFYKKIISELPQYLKKGANVYFEVGINQAKTVAEMLKNLNFVDIEIVKDYYNIERFVKAKFIA